MRRMRFAPFRPNPPYPLKSPNSPPPTRTRLPADCTIFPIFSTPFISNPAR